MIGLAIGVGLCGVAIAISVVIALLRGAISWLGAFFHNPLGVLVGTVFGASILGTIIGVFLHVLAYQDTRHGGWIGSVTEMWSSAHGHGQIDQGSAWFDLSCMFICPAVLILFLLLLLIASIVNRHAQAKADRLEQEHAIAQAKARADELKAVGDQAQRIYDTIYLHRHDLGDTDLALCKRFVDLVVSHADNFDTKSLNIASAIESALKLGPSKAKMMIPILFEPSETNAVTSQNVK